MVTAVAHHWVNLALVLAGIPTGIEVVLGNQEIIHFLLQQLLARVGVLDVTSRGPSSISGTLILVLILDSILHAEVSVPVRFLSSGSLVVAVWRFLRHDSQRINEEGEVFLEMG